MGRRHNAGKSVNRAGISVAGNPRGADPIVIQPGERVAQMMLVHLLRPEFSPLQGVSGAIDRVGCGFASTGA